MTPDLIREVAEAVLRDQLILNWHFYVLIGCASIVAGVVVQFVASYFKKRGDTFATKTDMREILRQVSETTRATEEVRSAVGQADWAAREWRKVRRLKLEQLLESAYSLDQWLDLQQSKYLFDEPAVANDAPMERLRLLSTLYFPELDKEAMAVWEAHQSILILTLEASKTKTAAEDSHDVAAHQKAFNDFHAAHKPLYEKARRAIPNLEEKASKLMAEVAGAR